MAYALAENGSEVLIATQSRIEGHPALKNLLDSKGPEVRSITPAFEPETIDSQGSIGVNDAPLFLPGQLLRQLTIGAESEF